MRLPSCRGGLAFGFLPVSSLRRLFMPAPMSGSAIQRPKIAQSPPRESRTNCLHRSVVAYLLGPLPARFSAQLESS